MSVHSRTVWNGRKSKRQAHSARVRLCYSAARRVPTTSMSGRGLTMKRISLFACALVLGVMAAAPAKADLQVIRWNTTKWCQVVDSNWIWAGAPKDYTVIQKGIATFDAAGFAL